MVVSPQIFNFKQIKQYRRLEDGSLNIVARGQQRFHVLKSWIDVEGAVRFVLFNFPHSSQSFFMILTSKFVQPCAQVEVVNEETPLRTPKDAFGQLASIINFQSGSVSRIDNLNISHRSEESDCDSAQSIHSAHSVGKENVLHSAISYCSESDGMDELTSESDDEYGHALFNPSGVSLSRRSSVHRSRQSASDIGSIDQCAATGRGAILGKRSADVGQGAARQAWAADESKWLCRAQKSFWPHWVYKMYDVDILGRRAAGKWTCLEEENISPNTFYGEKYSC